MNTINNPLTQSKSEEMVKRALEAYCNSNFNNVAGVKVDTNFPVKVFISNRMFSCAGEAKCARVQGRWLYGMIKLNARLLGRVDDKEQYEVVSHELAHCVDYYLRGDSDHGKFWKQIHRAMGGKGARCHEFDTKGLCRTQPLHYVRDNRTGVVFKLKTRTANRIKNNPTHYVYHNYTYIGLVETAP